MEKRARPGNPNILETGVSTRMPALSPGEKSENLGIRLPSSVVRRLETLAKAKGGTKSQQARKAIEQYLATEGY